MTDRYESVKKQTLPDSALKISKEEYETARDTLPNSEFHEKYESKPDPNRGSSTIYTREPDNTPDKVSAVLLAQILEEVSSMENRIKIIEYIVIVALVLAVLGGIISGIMAMNNPIYGLLF